MKNLALLILIGINTFCIAQPMDSVALVMKPDTLKVELFDNACLPIVATKGMLKLRFRENPKIHRIRFGNSKHVRHSLIYYSYLNSKASYIKTGRNFMFFDAIFNDNTLKLCYQNIVFNHNTRIDDIISRFPQDSMDMYNYPFSYIVSSTLFNLEEDENRMTTCIPLLTNNNMIMRFFFFEDKLIYIDLVEK